MSTEANKAVVRRYIEDVVNTGDVSAIARFISPSYVEIHENEAYPMGIEGAREHVRGVRATYPDLHVTVEQQIAESDWVATRITAHGTHRGAWLGIRPTGKRIRITGVNIDRIEDGRIVEHGGAANLLGPLLEIGAVRAVGK
ncbi:MAG: ester cyclase [Planctomycetota bacterium]|jgi:predicted ester cyclase